MTVKQLRAFLAVAQSLSFAQAGERLHLSQPALSLAIKNLEESLGGQLLVRTTRSTCRLQSVRPRCAHRPRAAHALSTRWASRLQHASRHP